MTPRPQISALVLYYSPLSTSGQTYNGVPQKVVLFSPQA